MGLIGHVLGGWGDFWNYKFPESGQSTTVTQGGNDPFDLGILPIDDSGAGNLSAQASEGTAQIRTDLSGRSARAEDWRRSSSILPLSLRQVGHFGTEKPGTVLGPGSNCGTRR